MRFTIEARRLIKRLWLSNNYITKTLKIFFMEDEVWRVTETDKKVVWGLNFDDLCSSWWTTTRTWVGDATTVIFFDKMIFLFSKYLFSKVSHFAFTTSCLHSYFRHIAILNYCIALGLPPPNILEFQLELKNTIKMPVIHLLCPSSLPVV